MRQTIVNFLITDPRSGQIIALSSLLILGSTVLSINVLPLTVVTIITSALLCEAIYTRELAQLPSAFISALSLSLLLRTQDLGFAVIAAIITISSKQLVRFHGQHIFNPTAFALVLTTSLSPHAWLSPGQWGQSFQLLLLVCVAGLIVTRKASRLDVSVSFLCAFVVLCFLRAAYLGDPIAIPIHQLSNGALLIFTFFMISDPRTTPRSRLGRLIFGSLVATVTALLQFGLYWNSAPIFALVFCAPFVPALNALFKGHIFSWNQSSQHLKNGQSNGVIHV